MRPTTLELAACAAWAAVAISAATPVGAFAITTQVGSYASCSASYSALAKGWCFDPEERHYTFNTSYTQTIKFVSTACSSGGCSPDTSTVYVDFVYAAGRKTVTVPEVCSTSYNIYNLGACAC